MTRWPQAALHAAVPVLFGVVALVLLGPTVLTRCGDSIFGGAGDSTAGLIWLEWNYDVLDAVPWRATTPLLNAPYGAPLWQPFYVTALVLMLPMWAVSQVVGPVCSWNVAVLGGLLLDGWIMYLFVRWLTRSVPVALLAGLAFLLLPYHYQKAHAHLAYVHSWVFVLILWAALRMRQRPTPARGAVLGLAIATACYTDGYYLLIATTFGAALAIGVLVAAGRDRPELLARLRAGAIAGVVLGVALIPIFLTLATSRSTISSAIERSSNDVATYSARPWEYVLPARHHPLLPARVGAWQDRHLHESNYSEQTLYLGSASMLGTLACVGLALLQRRRRHDEDDPRPLGLPAASVVVGGGALAALVMSAPPRIRIGGISLVMPSGIISSALAFWRVYARFFLPVAVCFIVLAAMALGAAAAAIRRRSPVAAALLVLALVPVVVLDFLPPRPPLQFSYERDTPEEYEWLDDRPSGQIIAEYPLDIPPLPNHISYLSYQRTHQQRLLNGAPAGSKDAHLAAGLAGLADPQTVPTLARLGVRYVVVHPTTFGHPLDDAALPPTLRKVHETPTGRVYEVDRSAAGAGALAPGEGFHGSDTSPAYTSSRWMRGRATLELRALERGARLFQVSFDAVSFGEPRRLEVRQGSKVLWRGDVSADEYREIEFAVDRPGDLRLVATPGAVPIKRFLPETGDDRPVALNLGDLRVVTTR